MDKSDLPAVVVVDVEVTDVVEVADVVETVVDVDVDTVATPKIFQ